MSKMTDADASTLASVAITPPSPDAPLPKEQDQLQPELPWYKRLDQNRNLLLIVASCAQFLDIVSIASVTIALPSLLRDVHYEQNQLQWVISSYALTYSAFLLVGGRMVGFLVWTVDNLRCMISDQRPHFLLYFFLRG